MYNKLYDDDTIRAQQYNDTAMSTLTAALGFSCVKAIGGRLYGHRCYY